MAAEVGPGSRHPSSRLPLSQSLPERSFTCVCVRVCGGCLGSWACPQCGLHKSSLLFPLSSGLQWPCDSASPWSLHPLLQHFVSSDQQWTGSLLSFLRVGQGRFFSALHKRYFISCRYFSRPTPSSLHPPPQACSTV